jgi:hypothetical protein
MTAVVGINWLWEVIVVADTRVSWRSRDTVLKKEDVLKKLYTIESSTSPQKTAVLGFSCDDLRTAKAVMIHLKVRKFQNYGRPLVMAHLKDDLHGWIEEVTIAKLSPEMRKGLRFMLCGIEPSRPSVVKKNDKVIRRIRMPRAHLYVYKVDRRSGRVTVDSEQDIAMIGSGRRVIDRIRESSNRWIGFGGLGQMQWARAHIMAEIVSLICRDSALGDIGGPFQTGCITSTGLVGDHYVWPPGVGSSVVKTEQEGERTIISNPLLGKKYILHPIWELSI